MGFQQHPCENFRQFCGSSSVDGGTVQPGSVLSHNGAYGKSTAANLSAGNCNFWQKDAAAIWIAQV